MSFFTITCVECQAKIKLRYNYCPECGNEIDELQKIIPLCFSQGFKYKSILVFIKRHLGISMSIRTLKTRLKFFGLKRRNPNVSQTELDSRIMQKLDSSQCQLGYRMMWNSLKMEGFVVPRRRVAESLNRLDPSGCILRRIHRLHRRKYFSMGPNYCWHVDGYGKLKLFGFPIHGCIDGYSRYVVWLKVLTSNNNPRIVCEVFLQAVSQNYFCPKKLELIEEQRIAF